VITEVPTPVIVSTLFEIVAALVLEEEKLTVNPEELVPDKGKGLSP
jgi:hypothetical protein